METAKQQSGEQHHIFIDESHHSTYQFLTSPSDKEKADEKKGSIPFDSMKNLFMLATFIGYRNQKRVRLENQRDIFTWQTLSTDGEGLSLIYALAVAETGNIEVLTDRNRVLTIAQEYANGGIIQIKKEIEDMPGDKIDNLVDLLVRWLPEDTFEIESEV